MNWLAIPIKPRWGFVLQDLSILAKVELQFYFEEEFVVAASHRAGEDGDVLGVQEVVDHALDGGALAAQPQLPLQREMAHVIGQEAARDAADLVAGGGEAFAVGVPLVGELPAAPAGCGREVGRVSRHIDELLAVGRVGLVEVTALVDGRRVGVVAHQGEMPVGVQLHLSGEGGLNAVVMYAFEVGGLPEAFGVGCPQNPVCDVGVEGGEVGFEGAAGADE